MRTSVIFLTLFVASFSLAQSNSGADDFDTVLSQSLGNPELKEESPKEEEFNPNYKVPKEVTDVKNLGELSSYEDVAVIQRKSLPKTNRFEFSPAVGGIINDSFFLNLQLQARLAYYLQETWGLEGYVNYYGTSAREITVDLQSDGTSTNAFITPRLQYGVDAKWVPFYGKVALFNKRIAVFDTFFAAGLGMTSTSQDTNPITFHAGMGQIYTLTRSMAFRWDIGWYWYSSETRATSTPSRGNFMNMVIGLGVSFFFPKPSYR